MPNQSSDSSFDPRRVERLLADLQAGDDTARDKILEACDERLRQLAHRLLGNFARVRRWDNTDDVAQGAAMRLYRALGETIPNSPRGLLGLMATVIQRELLDLARKHAGNMSYASNHHTNVQDWPQGTVYFVDEAVAETGDDEDIPLDRWEAFHAVVEELPEEAKELFRLVWYLGLDRREVAEAMGMSIRTVARRWDEARELVRRALEEAGESVPR